MNELTTLTGALSALRLSPNAIRFYLASYTTGRSTIGKVALLAKLDRSSAYLAAQQLIDIGILAQDFKKARRIVWAESPKTVQRVLRTQIRGLQRQHQHIESALPELLAHYSEREHKPVLQFFEGREGLGRISEDVIAHAGAEILLFSNQTSERKVFSGDDHQSFIRDRRNSNIHIRVLAPDTAEARTLQKSDAKMLRETRLIPGPVPFTSETYIYGDRVAMLSFDREIIGFIVRSPEFSRQHRWMFEELWERFAPQKKEA